MPVGSPTVMSKFEDVSKSKLGASNAVEAIIAGLGYVWLMKIVVGRQNETRWT